MQAEVSIDMLRKVPKRLRIEIEENIVRKAFTQEELAGVQETIRQIAAASSPKGGRPKAGEKPTQQVGEVSAASRHQSEADAMVGRLFGESSETVRRRREVVQAAKAEPEKFGHLVAKMNATGKVGGVHKQLKIAKQAEAIAKEPPPLPTGPFRVLVIDPPWRFDNRSEDPTHRGSNPYPSMSIEQITALPVESLAESDSVLWLWTTNSHQRYAYEIAEAWGFQHKTTLTWFKPQIGLGDYLRNSTEPCLLCVRGKPTLTLSSQGTGLIAPRGEHSKKPDSFYQLVESLCPGSKAELFSRCNRPGWTTWGDERGTISGQD